MTSHRLPVQNGAPSGTVWPSFEEGVLEIISFGSYRLHESDGVGSCANRKPTHDFPIPLDTMFCYICRHLTGIPMLNYAPLRPTDWG